MKLAIIGTGYVGLVTGACFAELGHSVCCIDTDQSKITSLLMGRVPFFEPQLDELVTRVIHNGTLRFATDAKAGIQDADIVFIAVGTPASERDGLPELAALQAAATTAIMAAKPGTLIVIKSTVPPGTTRWLAGEIARMRPHDRLAAASNPEFLRQGAAVYDFMHPDRIVIGVENEQARAGLEALYAPLSAPNVITTYESAELIKYAANTLLAAKVAFINEMANLCEAMDGDITAIAQGIGLDHRIGPHFLTPGPGFGGSCFPKDTLALLSLAREKHEEVPLVKAVLDSNIQHKKRMVDKIIRACGGSVAGKTLAILGLTFKAGTDDLRESVSLVVVPALAEQGAKLALHDPRGMEPARRAFARLDASKLTWHEYRKTALEGADAAIILTEWPEYKALDLKELAGLLNTPTLIDCRNLFTPAAAKAAGLHYVSVGRA